MSGEQGAEACGHCGATLIGIVSRCHICNTIMCVRCVEAHVAKEHPPTDNRFTYEGFNEMLRKARSSSYTFSARIDFDPITIENLEEIFRRFSTGGPYARAQATRSAPM